MINKSLIIRKSAVHLDPAFGLDGRGARKIAVTSVRPDSEVVAQDIEWRSVPYLPTPVMHLPDTEYAVFTEQADQQRHYHNLATEFYTVLEGEMYCIVASDSYHLCAGDSIVVPPGVVHEIVRSTHFLTQVISVHCGGETDKYVV